MRGSNRRIVFLAGVALFILVWATAIGPEPPARIAISPNELVRAVTLHRDSLIDLCLMDRVDPNGRDAEGRTSLLIDRKSTRLNSSHQIISYAVFCLKKKK